MEQLAKERGIDISQFGNRGGGNRDRASNAPVTRTLYKLVGDPAAPQLQAVSVKLGIYVCCYSMNFAGIMQQPRYLNRCNLDSHLQKRPSLLHAQNRTCARIPGTQTQVAFQVRHLSRYASGFQ